MAVIKKRVLCPEQLRRVPPQFSWIDHRLVRDSPDIASHQRG
jgi:hypothetical protein